MTGGPRAAGWEIRTRTAALLDAARRDDEAASTVGPGQLAASIRSLVDVGDAPAALELLGRLGRRFLVTNELEAGSEVARMALEAAGGERAHPWRSRALCFDGMYAFRQGDRARSLARNEEALALSRATDDLLGECEAATGLARIALRDGDPQRAVDLTLAAHDHATAAGDDRAAAAPLHVLAAGLRLRGRYAEARERYVESLELNRRLGNAGWVSMELHNLGWIDLHLGQADSAAAWFAAAVPGSDAYSSAWSDLEQAGVDLVRGDRDTARNRFERALGRLRALGVVPDPDDQAELDWLAAELGPGRPPG